MRSPGTTPAGFAIDNVSFAGFPGIPLGQTFGVGCNCSGAEVRYQHYTERPVNTATGALTEQYVDIALPGMGVPFIFQRTYTSADTTGGPLGTGWTHPFLASLTVDQAGDVLVRAEDGQQLVYEDLGGGQYATPPGARSVLEATGSGWLLTKPDLSTLTFDSVGRVTAMDDVTGEGLSLSYVGGALSSVTDSAGRVITFEHTAGLLTKVSLPDGRYVQYGYTDGKLTTVTDLRGKTTTFAYDAQGYLASELDPNGNYVFRNTFDPATGRVVAQLDPRGKETTFEWDPVAQTSTMTDPKGGEWVEGYVDNVLVRQVDPLGHQVRYSYDEELNRTSVTDARDNTTTMTYDADGNMLTRTSPPIVAVPGQPAVQYTETWTYDAFNQVTSHQNRRQQTTTFEYFPTTHLLKKVTDPLGRATEYTYTAAGLVDTITDPRAKITDFDYDADGNLTTVTTPEGNITSFGYDGFGRRTSMVEARGNAAGGVPADFTWTYDYNAGDQLTLVTDPKNHTTGYSYDNTGNLVTLTNAENKDTHYTYLADNRLDTVKDPRDAVLDFDHGYDDNGNLTSVLTPAGTTTYGYDAANRRTSEVTPRGNVSGAVKSAFTWTYVYDSNGNLTSQTHPTASSTAYNYDAFDRLVTVTDAHAKQTRYQYDSNSNLLKTTNALGDATTYSYDNADQLQAMTDAKGKVTGYDYDASGNRNELTTPLGNVWKWSYDGDGRLVSEVEPRGNVGGSVNPADYTTTYTYWPGDYLKQVTRPLNRWTKYDYDQAGNLTSVIDGNNHTTSYTYDALDRLHQVTGPASTNLGTTTYGYDDSGNLNSRLDANNRTSSWVYNTAGQLEARTTPVGTWAYTYDAAGNLKTETKPSGTATATAGDGTVEYTYDHLDRLTGLDYSDSTSSVTYTYDELYLTAMNDGLSTDETYTYDDIGQVKTITRGTAVFGYDYDPVGQVTGRTHPDGTTINQTWDDDGRPDLYTATTGTTTVSADYGYDQAGSLTSIANGNGITQTRTYDRTGWIDTISTQRVSNNALIAEHDYTHDNVGNPTNILHRWSLLQTGNEVYEYDAANRLTKICYASSCSSGNRRTYTYDPVGNRLTEDRIGGDKPGLITSTYNNKDQLTQTSRPLLFGNENITYEYDPNGNMTKAGARTYTYDLADRPISTTTSGGATTTYGYDGDGNRLTSTTGSTTTTYTWDKNHPLPEMVNITTGATVRKFFNDPAGDPIAQIIPGTGNNTGLHYLHTDAIGSIRAATNSSATRNATYAYEPFGTARPSPTNQGTLENPIGYAGEYQDPTTGLYHLRARDYDTTTGRFDGLDPIAQDITDPYASEYIYVTNQPTRLIDPSGLGWLDKFAGGGSRVGGTAHLDTPPKLPPIKPPTMPNLSNGGTRANPADGGVPRCSNQSILDRFFSRKARDERGSAQVPGRRLTDEQQTIIDWAREYKRSGGISRGDADALVDLAKGAFPGYRNFHGRQIHPGRRGRYANILHIKVYGIHIPVI